MAALPFWNPSKPLEPQRSLIGRVGAIVALTRPIGYAWHGPAPAADGSAAWHGCRPARVSSGIRCQRTVEQKEFSRGGQDGERQLEAVAP